MISTGEIRQVIEYGMIIENYPEDARGHSCLILGQGEAHRPIHVVCALKEDYLAIITACIPGVEDWADDFKMRKKL
jgi:protein tyrosine/serine phosphatase